MKKLYVVQPKDGQPHRYVGLSKEENGRFWREENDFNQKVDKILNVCSLVSGLLLATFSFNTKFEIGIFEYLLFSTLHSIHITLYIGILMSEYGNLNIFIISAFRFFRKRYEAINRKIEKLQRKKTRNGKLKRILADFNYVTMELCQINKYLSHFVGSYFFVVLFSCTTLGYLIFKGDFIIKIVVFYALIQLLFFIILLPYYQSTKVLLEVKFESTGF